MSGWDGYVNDMMKDTGFFDNACILSKEDYGVWATTDAFHVFAHEAANLVEIAAVESSPPPASFTVQAVEYIPILVEKNRIYAEMKESGNAGIIVLVGKKCVIFGTYPPTVQPAFAVDVAEKLLIYLGEQGF